MKIFTAEHRLNMSLAAKRRIANGKNNWAGYRFWETGEKHPKWIGGKRTREDGFILIRDTKNKRYLLEHRIIMEKFLKRTLISQELVHHKNGDRTNNRIRNLQIVSRGEHNKIHIRNPEGKGGFNYGKMRLDN